MAKDQSDKKSTRANDDEYKDAVQSVVDDNMRTDMLGPAVVKVLKEHTPASDQLKCAIAEAIASDPKVREAFEKTLGDFDTKRKGRWMDRLIAWGIGVASAVVIALLVALTNGYIKLPHA